MDQVSREDLRRFVRDALGQLPSEAALAAHPLAGLLVPEVLVGARGPALRRLIVEAMQELRPAHTVPYDAPAWRRYRSLFEHYLEGKAFDEIADAEGISGRQARRDHLQALDALGDLFWTRYRRGRERRAGHEGDPPPEDELGLERELLRLAQPADAPTSVAETLRGAVSLVQSLADALRANLDVRVAEGLPPVTANQMVLRQALLGLLSYSVESSPGESVQVEAAATAHGVEVRIAVEGWPGQLPVDDEGGRLTVCRRLLEAQGDRLEVATSTDGDRRRLRIRLGLAARDLPTVLVVDDNPDVARLFGRYLEGEGYRLVQATTAQGALRLAREARPRAITLDLMMPARDGWELLQLLKGDSETRRIPVIVCSVLQERALAMALGASAFLAKPIARPDLLAALERATGAGE